MPKLGTKIAVVAARGLGDGLIAMVLSANFKKAGLAVDTYSTPLMGLQRWFPEQRLHHFPEPHLYYDVFSRYDSVINADHSIIESTHVFGNQQFRLKENAFDRRYSLVENLKLFCEQLLNKPCEAEIGICPPLPLTHRKFLARIVLHPTSLEEKRTWPAEKFINVATRLIKMGYDPYFCVGASERKEWVSRCGEKRVPFFETLNETAQFVYESGYHIGNNSGIGHLASALGIPTLSLFARQSYARLWRPGWSYGVVVTPPSLLPGARLKQKYWKQLLGPRRVIRYFEKLRRDASASSPQGDRTPSIRLPL